MTEPPDAPETKLQEYLEKYAADGLKRELDMEDAVWRSLPAFISALSILGGVLAYLGRTASLEPEWSLAFLSTLLMAAGLVAAVVSFGHLSEAVRKRRHRYPPDELQVCAWAKGLLQTHTAAGLEVGVAERQALKDLREKILDEVAAAASNSHNLNAEKQAARTKATRWLFAAAVFTMISGALSAVGDSGRNIIVSNVGQATAVPSASASASASSVGREEQNGLAARTPVTLQPPEVATVASAAPSQHGQAKPDTGSEKTGR